MELRRISDTLTVSPQIEPHEVTEIASAGYRSILCNRPDGEEIGQTDFEAVSQAAREAGIEARHVPVVSGHMTQDDIDGFRSALAEMPGPVLAYCRTGTRCAVLWSVIKFGELPSDDILRATGEAGYDMSGLIAKLEREQ